MDTVSSAANLSPAAGDGIAVVGGADHAWWAPADPTLSFSIVIEDSGNNITANSNIGLTGVAMRWGAAATATFAGQSNIQSATLQGVDLPTGQPSETSFTANILHEVTKRKTAPPPSGNAGIPTPRNTASETETISWIKAHHDSPHGRISVSWNHQDDGSLLYEATISPNTNAELILPKSSPWGGTDATLVTHPLTSESHRFLIAK